MVCKHGIIWSNKHANGLEGRKKCAVEQIRKMKKGFPFGQNGKRLFVEQSQYMTGVKNDSHVMFCCPCWLAIGKFEPLNTLRTTAERHLATHTSPDDPTCRFPCLHHYKGCPHGFSRKRN
ncbi:uncharacterized protein JCM10292_000363 [Rhodotorula paludigena]|uniref:uncharacterized protein n=1 Tax=Rhodotorula paludigena TaxID=86838 RepID=UPI00317BA1B7